MKINYLPVTFLAITLAVVEVAADFLIPNLNPNFDILKIISYCSS